MFLEKEKYFLVEEFKNFSIIAAMSKKELGNMADYVKIGNSLENKRKFIKLLGLNNRKIVDAKQTHSTNILNIDNDFNIDIYNNNIEYDGFITSRKDVVIFTYYADCLPLYMIDYKKNIIGIAHSGWKGSFNEILKELINKFKIIYNSELNDLKLAIGIGIDVFDYEVKIDFYENFSKKFPDISNECFKFLNEKIFFDNTNFNYLLALKLGIKKENIIIDDRGVKNASIFSYRLDKEKIGRSAAIIAFE